MSNKSYCSCGLPVVDELGDGMVICNRCAELETIRNEKIQQQSTIDRLTANYESVMRRNRRHRDAMMATLRMIQHNISLLPKDDDEAVGFALDVIDKLISERHPPIETSFDKNPIVGMLILAEQSLADNELNELDRKTIECERWRDACTPSSKTKRLHMSEYEFNAWPSSEISEMMVTVPWITIKEIMKAISDQALGASGAKQ